MPEAKPLLPRPLFAHCKTLAKRTQQPSQFEFVCVVYPVKEVIKKGVFQFVMCEY